MNTTKLFDQFIEKNFQGLSAYTLSQTLNDTLLVNKEVVSNMIYVSLYNVFVNKASNEDIVIYENIKNFINGKPVSNMIYLDCGIVDITKVEEWLMYAFSNTDVTYLKNNSLDWYLNNIITLNQFKLIVAM